MESSYFRLLPISKRYSLPYHRYLQKRLVPAPVLFFSVMEVVCVMEEKVPAMFFVFHGHCVREERVPVLFFLRRTSFAVNANVIFFTCTNWYCLQQSRTRVEAPRNGRALFAVLCERYQVGQSCRNELLQLLVWAQHFQQLPTCLLPHQNLRTKTYSYYYDYWTRVLYRVDMEYQQSKACVRSYCNYDTNYNDDFSYASKSVDLGCGWPGVWGSHRAKYTDGSWVVKHSHSW